MSDALKKALNANGIENVNSWLGKEGGTALMTALREYEEMLKRGEDGFAQGVVYACALVCQLHDEPGIAKDVLKESGVDVTKAAEYDVAFLRKEQPDLPRGMA